MLGNCPFFSTSNCSLRTHQIRWAWLLGPDSWPDRSLSWSAGWEKQYTSCHSLVHVSYIAFIIWHPVLMSALDFWLHAVSICCAGATNVNDIDWTTRKNTAFADHLLKTLGKGAESCQGIQEAAQCVVEESNGNCSELTKRFAKIGTSGRNPQNCERDLFRLINLPVESWLWWYDIGFLWIMFCFPL